VIQLQRNSFLFKGGYKEILFNKKITKKCLLEDLCLRMILALNTKLSLPIDVRQWKLVTNCIPNVAFKAHATTKIIPLDTFFS